MEQNAINEVMVSLGGEQSSDRDGEFWLFSVGEFIAELEPFFRKHGNTVTVGVDVSISNPRLSEIAAAIIGAKRGSRKQIEWHQIKEALSGQFDLSVGLRNVVLRELDYVKNLRIESIVSDFASNCPDRPSMKQIMHLAALASRGDVQHLSEYLDGMRLGKRFNFVPMISSKMLERAIEVAT